MSDHCAFHFMVPLTWRTRGFGMKADRLYCPKCGETADAEGWLDESE